MAYNELSYIINWNGWFHPTKPKNQIVQFSERNHWSMQYLFMYMEKIFEMLFYREKMRDKESWWNKIRVIKGKHERERERGREFLREGDS